MVDFGDFRPSSIAAAATLCSADEIPDLARTDHGSAASWGTGMDRVRPKITILVVLWLGGGYGI